MKQKLKSFAALAATFHGVPFVPQQTINVEKKPEHGSYFEKDGKKLCRCGCEAIETSTGPVCTDLIALNSY